MAENIRQTESNERKPFNPERGAGGRTGNRPEAKHGDVKTDRSVKTDRKDHPDRPEMGGEKQRYDYPGKEIKGGKDDVSKQGKNDYPSKEIHGKNDYPSKEIGKHEGMDPSADRPDAADTGKTEDSEE